MIDGKNTENLMLLNRIKSSLVIPANRCGNDFFVGDIHGHRKLLEQQLDSLGFDFSCDRLFCAGDIIDRGEQSQECLDLLMQPWFFSTLGNHEALFLQGFEQPRHWQTLINNGGQWLENLLNEPQLLLRLAQLVRIKMPLSFTVDSQYGQIGVVHAEAPKNWRVLDDLLINEQNVIPFIWHRRNLSQCAGEVIQNIDAVVHGHNSINSPIVINNQLWIDTIQQTGVLTILEASDVINLIKNKG